MKSLLKYGMVFIIARLIAGTVFQVFAPVTSNMHKISMVGFLIHSIVYLVKKYKEGY